MLGHCPLISQKKYLAGLLNQFGMEGCKPMFTPPEPGKKFHKRTDDKEQCDQSIYQQPIGCLTYVSTAMETGCHRSCWNSDNSCLIQARTIGWE